MIIKQFVENLMEQNESMHNLLLHISNLIILSFIITIFLVSTNLKLKEKDIAKNNNKNENKMKTL